jgi:hypothetical protein
VLQKGKRQSSPTDGIGHVRLLNFTGPQQLIAWSMPGAPLELFRSVDLLHQPSTPVHLAGEGSRTVSIDEERRTVVSDGNGSTAATLTGG